MVGLVMINHCSSFLSLHMLSNLSTQCRFRRTPVTSAARRRHHRRRLLKYSPNHDLATTPSTKTGHTILKLSDNTLQINLTRPSKSLQQIETKVNQLLDYGRETFDDLRSIVTYDEDNGGIVISCRRSSVEFLVGFLVSSLLVVVAIRGIFKLRKNGGEALVYKRDRSLGGREVLVGKSDRNWSSNRTITPLSSDSASNSYQKKSEGRTLSRRRKETLASWWPQVVSSVPHETSNVEEYQRMANQLVQGWFQIALNFPFVLNSVELTILMTNLHEKYRGRWDAHRLEWRMNMDKKAITDRKMSGEDISTNDIAQLRHICKTYGVRAPISTANTRDSFYRVSINFILNYCECARSDFTSIQINGEDVREFIAGLADNIGLESTRASRMVSAAVAARTRSKILQAWAFEVQNKRSEALLELSKVCIIHKIFPPERNSPEMEMVARGLDKSLSVEQRKYILDLFISFCGEDVDQSVVEALGLEGEI